MSDPGTRKSILGSLAVRVWRIGFEQAKNSIESMKDLSPEATRNYLEQLPANIRQIADLLCSVTRTEMPGAYEFVYHNAINFSWSEKVSERVCCVWAQKTYVNYLFFYAVGLPDPKGLFEKGTGVRIRHIKVRSVEEARNPALREIARAAWIDAPKSIETQRSKRKVKSKKLRSDTGGS